MLETPHVVFGALIASKITNPILSLPLSFFSHFLLERVPHWNPHLNTEIKEHGRVTKQSLIIVTADATSALVLGSGIALSYLPDYQKTITVFAACFLSVLPDVIEAPYFFLNIKSRMIEKWIKFQKSLQNDAPPFVGLLTQGVTILAGVWWLFI